MRAAESGFSSLAQRGPKAPEIDRVLERLERHRCESCSQISLVPHLRMLAHNEGGRPHCKPQIPLPTGYSLTAA